MCTSSRFKNISKPSSQRLYSIILHTKNKILGHLKVFINGSQVSWQQGPSFEWSISAQIAVKTVMFTVGLSVVLIFHLGTVLPVIINK